MNSLEGLDAKWLSRLMKQQYYMDKPADIIRVESESAVPKGENYVSIIKRVKFHTLTATGSRKTFTMITKQLKDSDGLKAALAALTPFRGEIRMFTTVLRDMEGLLDEFNDKRGTLWPKFYGSIPYNMIVLEDLKGSGYVLMDRKGWLELDYALLVLRGVGRFHAMSKVLMERGVIGSADDKGNHWIGQDNSSIPRMFKSALFMLAQSMLMRSGSWTTSWDDLAERVIRRSETLSEEITRQFTDYDQNFNVLCHGDLWTTNMMFQVMEYTNAPSNVKLLDFQFCHVNSFMWDVTYFLYTSVVPSVRRANKRTLLEAYHRSLADNLELFNYEGYLPTLDDVISEDKRLLLAGFAFLTCILPITSATTEDAFKMENLATGTPEEIFNQDAFTEEKFVREIGDDLKEFANLGVI